MIDLVDAAATNAPKDGAMLDHFFPRYVPRR
jgi:hypothetical protein